jgi:hypothetical protein
MESHWILPGLLFKGKLDAADFRALPLPVHFVLLKAKLKGTETLTSVRHRPPAGNEKSSEKIASL